MHSFGGFSVVVLSVAPAWDLASGSMKNAMCGFCFILDLVEQGLSPSLYAVKPLLS